MNGWREENNSPRQLPVDFVAHVLKQLFFLEVGGFKLFESNCGSVSPQFPDSETSKSHFEDVPNLLNAETRGWAPITAVRLPRSPGSSPPPALTALGPGPHRLLQTHFPELLKFHAQGLLQGSLAVKQPSKTV